jgi:hypothetical protein
VDLPAANHFFSDGSLLQVLLNIHICHVFLNNLGIDARLKDKQK